MDTNYELKLLVEAFDEPFKTKFKTGVLTHINRSEYYFNKALDENDEMYFTDVIYRCNHAYEGVLKEAYFILFGEESGNKTPDKIEKGFLENNVINDRVKNQFTSYRQDWRNPSTHDYQLFFSKEEAFMAILSVSSFVYTLLSQLLVSQSYNKLKDTGINSDPINGFDFKEILTLILDFPIYLKSKNITTATEFRTIGYLAAYLEGIFSDLLIKTEYRFKGGMADIVIEYKENIICVVEIKKYIEKNYDNAHNQVLKYMEILKCQFGIVYLYSDDENTKYNVIFDEVAGYVGYIDKEGNEVLNKQELGENKNIGNAVAIVSPLNK
jgi:Holliday junction resolvase-like predicted endonuclease